MAYTKAPEGSSHDTQRIAALGQPFEVAANASRIPGSLNYLDCFPVENKQFQDKPIITVNKREAFKSLSTTNALTTPNPLTSLGPMVAGSEQLANPTTVFFAYKSGVAVGTAIGAFTTNNPVIAGVNFLTNLSVGSGTSVIDPSNADQGFVYFGSNNVSTGAFNISSYNVPTGTFVATTTLAENIDSARGLVYLDSYMFAVGSLSALLSGNANYNVIYNSSASGGYTVWNTTEYTDATIYPGEIYWLDKHHNHLVAFGSNSVEFFYDAGNGLGSPLSRQVLYAKNMGVWCPPKVNFEHRAPFVARDTDDLYFIGKNDNSLYSVYKISNYQLTEVATQYVQDVLNYWASGSYTNIASVESIVLNSNTHIMITFVGSSTALCYYTQGDVWWTMTTTDLYTNSLTTLRTNILHVNNPTTGTHRPYFITARNTNDGYACVQSSDLESTISNSATYTSEVIDFGVNYWKHVARVDAVGDYGANTLTLSYYNNPAYVNAVTCTTKSPSADGYQNAVYWSNVIRARRFALALTMTGIGNAEHRAFDVQYNIGVS